MQIKKQRNIVFILLVCIIALGGFLWIRNDSSNSDLPDNPFFSAEKVPDITKIEIHSPEQNTTLTFNTEKSNWYVTSENNFIADHSALNTLLIFLKEMKVNSVASNNKDNLDSFKLSEDTRTTINLFKGDGKVNEIYIGKTATGGNTTYVTGSNTDTVYVMDKNLPSVIKTDWQNKEVLTFAPQEISQITWVRNGEILTVEKQDAIWKGVKPEAFDVSQEVIATLLDSSSVILATDIPSQNGELDDEMMNITFLKNNQEKTLRFYKHDAEGKVFVKDPDFNLYVISQSTFDLLNKTREDLIVK